MKVKREVKRLGDVCDKSSSNISQNQLANEDGVYPIFGAGGFIKNVSFYHQDKEYVAIIKDGAGIGRLSLLPAHSSVIGTLQYLVPKDILNIRYFFYFLSSIDFGKYKNGSTIPHIYFKDYADEPILVLPIPEQIRIVAVLDEAFGAIAKAKESAEKNLANARELFESHLQSIFTKSDSSHIPHQLDTVCKEITVGHVGSMAKQYKDQGVPFLRSQNIRPFHISLDNVVFIDKAFHKTLAKSQLRPGDVAVVRTGYPGTAAVIPDSLPVCNCSDLVIVRPGPAADPHYLTLFFNSELGKKLVAGRLVGSAQKHFNVTAAKQVTISFPPIHEQRRRVAEIQALRVETQRLESIYLRKLADLEELKKSILQKAFSGEFAGVRS